MRWRTVLVLAALCCVAVEGVCRDQRKKCAKKVAKGKCRKKKIAKKKCKKSCGTCLAEGKGTEGVQCNPFCEMRDGASLTTMAFDNGVCTRKEGDKERRSTCLFLGTVSS